MMLRWIALATFAAVIGASTLRADDAPPTAPQGWSGKGQAGYVMSRGTTDTDTANAKLDVADSVDDWKHTLHLEGLYGRNGDVTSAERWAVAAQSNYQYTPRAFVFGALHYLDDEFSGFEYQADVSTGPGYKFLTSASDKLEAQIGAGYRRLRPELLVTDAAGAVIERIAGNTEGNVIGTAGFDYEHDFNASTRITEKYQVDSGAGNTQMENDLALVVNMSKKLALSAGFTLQENTQPPVAVRKDNTLTTLNLVYAFNQ